MLFLRCDIDCESGQSFNYSLLILLLRRSLMISSMLCPIGKSHSLPLWHLIHDHCLFVNAFVSLGCSRIPFTFYLSPASLACFYECDGASSTSTVCTRPQGLVSKARTFPEHQRWFTASKSHFYADVSQINIFSPDRLS